ncbi:MAG: phosphate signaling complex protein PhoU [Rhodobacteraceae bacterium]|nr:phosphate signaling complex protein PhoU [Paracoccaceae bacterium]
MENNHIVGRFDKDLNKIKNRVLKMGDLVLSQFEAATRMLNTPDTMEIAQIVATDRKINGMERAISNRAERLITLRQPVALDLRAVLTPINIANDLERIGDHAKSTAKRAGKMGANAVPEPTLAILMQMANLAQLQLREALNAYDCNDLELAAAIRERDTKVDALNSSMFSHALSNLTGSENNTEALMNAVLISRNFERIGDHVVNIAEFVIHITTGNENSENDVAK